MEQALHPAYLPAGTRVGPWRLVHPLGRGGFGTVYRAERVERKWKSSSTAAVKLAHAPNDERFAREAGLLSRLHHPGIPRLLGQGHWQSPAALPHPFIAMERVDGLPLYEWARATNPSSRRLLRLFAGLARALEAVHALGAIHQDVKGANLLVRAKDSRGFLVDFGSCVYPGAAMTWRPWPPGTLEYRAPEALAHLHRRPKDGGPSSPSSPTPAEDVFALGVAAWRLVVGTYPATYPPIETPAGPLDDPGPRPAQDLNPRCSEELSDLVARMLSVRPQARGSAGELAEALERAARRAGRAADAPLFPRDGSSPQERPHAWVSSHGEHRTGLARLTAAGLAAGVAFAAYGVASQHSRETSSPERAPSDTGGPDGGTISLGETVLAAPGAAPPMTATSSLSGLDLPSTPLPGQLRPDAQGRCPSRNQVAINGGCWKRTTEAPEDCDEYSFVYKGACYLPVFPYGRLPTSGPSDVPDGGTR